MTRDCDCNGTDARSYAQLVADNAALASELRKALPLEHRHVNTDEFCPECNLYRAARVLLADRLDAQAVTP